MTIFHREMVRGKSYADHLMREFEIYRPWIRKKIRSLYWGGGSPLELDPKQLLPFYDVLNRNFDFGEAEITFESNPHWSAYSSYYDAMNRISIGVQSFSPKQLATLGRPYAVCSSFLRDIGERIKNVSFDMIFDIPGAEEKDFEKDIKEALALAPPHLSWYSLELDSPGLRSQMPSYQEKMEPPRLFQRLVESMNRAGYEHYELSNFARSDSMSVHNLAYWEQKPYLGLGPGAVGTLPVKGGGFLRYTNVKSLKRYIQCLEEGRAPYGEIERLSPIDLVNEHIMLHMRRSEGVDTEAFQEKFNFSFMEQASPVLKKYPDFFDTSTKRRIRLNARGFAYYNSICAELFII